MQPAGRGGEGDEGGPAADTVQRDPRPPAQGPAISTLQGLLGSLAAENHILFVDKQQKEVPNGAWKSRLHRAF